MSTAGVSAMSVSTPAMTASSAGQRQSDVTSH